MPQFLVYILESKEIDRFYIGMTSINIDERLRRHLSDHKGFTGKTKDWKVVYWETFGSKTEASKRELELKSWKNKARIQKLIFEHSSAGSAHPDL